MHVDRAGAVAELQAQVVAAVAPLPALDLANQQHLVDLAPSVSSFTSMTFKVDPSADAMGPQARGGMLGRSPRRRTTPAPRARADCVLPVGH